jgi:RNA polymerase sigma factor (sigma-70 family)
LVRDALEGARDPLAELLRRHWDTAVFLATRVLGSADLARDAAQEAAIAAMTDLDRLRCPDRFGAWFCGIALNVSRRWLRQLRSEMPGVLPEQVSTALGPAEAAEISDLAARVRTAIAALPDGQRDAVMLFYLQGLSHHEVACELNISVGAVKARLHQGRAGLAPRLARLIEIPEVLTVSPNDAVQWADVSVSAIRRGAQGDNQGKHIMILQESGGDRWLPIWIGPAEATALALTLESDETPRPFTHKLAVSLVQAAGSQVSEVRITRLLEQVFYASVVVRGPDGAAAVDSRPSDAVNLALAAGAPIRVDSELFSVAVSDDEYRKLESYPVVTAEIVTEARQRIRELTGGPERT